MHLKTAFAHLLAVVAAVGAQTIDFECAASGPGQNACASLVSRFCSTEASLTFAGLESGSRCFNTGAIKCFFTAWNQDPGEPLEAYSVTNCNLSLNNVTRLCASGAGSGTANGQFKWFVSGTNGSSGCDPV